jgi:hypothetical protein
MAFSKSQIKNQNRYKIFSFYHARLIPYQTWLNILCDLVTDMKIFAPFNTEIEKIYIEFLNEIEKISKHNDCQFDQYVNNTKPYKKYYFSRFYREKDNFYNFSYHSIRMFSCGKQIKYDQKFLIYCIEAYEGFFKHTRTENLLEKYFWDYFQLDQICNVHKNKTKLYKNLIKNITTKEVKMLIAYANIIVENEELKENFDFLIADYININKKIFEL